MWLQNTAVKSYVVLLVSLLRAVLLHMTLVPLHSVTYALCLCLVEQQQLQGMGKHVWRQVTCYCPERWNVGTVRCDSLHWSAHFEAHPPEHSGLRFSSLCFFVGEERCTPSFLKRIIWNCPFYLIEKAEQYMGKSHFLWKLLAGRGMLVLWRLICWEYTRPYTRPLTLKYNSVCDRISFKSIYNSNSYSHIWAPFNSFPYCSLPYTKQEHLWSRTWSFCLLLNYFQDASCCARLTCKKDVKVSLCTGSGVGPCKTWTRYSEN